MTIYNLQNRSRAVQGELDSLIQSLMEQVREAYNQVQENNTAARRAASQIRELTQELAEVRAEIVRKTDRITLQEDGLGCCHDHVCGESSDEME